MSVFQFPQRRHVLGVAAMALTMTAFSALPVSAAGPKALGLGANAQVETNVETNIEARMDSERANVGTYHRVDPTVEMQMQGETAAEPQSTSYSGTRLYNEAELKAKDAIRAVPQRTARAAIDSAAEYGPNTMHAMNGAMVTFNE